MIGIKRSFLHSCSLYWGEVQVMLPALITDKQQLIGAAIFT